jgi:hypothetical protein
MGFSIPALPWHCQVDTKLLMGELLPNASQARPFSALMGPKPEARFRSIQERAAFAHDLNI